MEADHSTKEEEDEGNGRIRTMRIYSNKHIASVENCAAETLRDILMACIARIVHVSLYYTHLFHLMFQFLLI